MVLFSRPLLRLAKSGGKVVWKESTAHSLPVERRRVKFLPWFIWATVGFFPVWGYFMVQRESNPGSVYARVLEKTYNCLFYGDNTIDQMKNTTLKSLRERIDRDKAMRRLAETDDDEILEKADEALSEEMEQQKFNSRMASAVKKRMSGWY